MHPSVRAHIHEHVARAQRPTDEVALATLEVALEQTANETVASRQANRKTVPEINRHVATRERSHTYLQPTTCYAKQESRPQHVGEAEPDHEGNPRISTQSHSTIRPAESAKVGKRSAGVNPYWASSASRSR